MLQELQDLTRIEVTGEVTENEVVLKQLPANFIERAKSHNSYFISKGYESMMDCHFKIGDRIYIEGGQPYELLQIKDGEAYFIKVWKDYGKVFIIRNNRKYSFAITAKESLENGICKKIPTKRHLKK